ncbi:MAG: AMP nucleosidase, partial [Alphaproteobacteria bacterium]|nr:AMP nucleosidase [Alphaproteobacteria bacterium]
MEATPQNIPPRNFDNPDDALAALRGIYDAGIAHLREHFRAFSKGEIPPTRVRAFYPQIRITVDNIRRPDSRFAYGFVNRPGVYAQTLTRPDIFGYYYAEQIRLLLKNHGGPVEISLSDTPIPVHFALGDNFHVEKDLTPELLARAPEFFDQPDLSVMDDTIANGIWQPQAGQAWPLGLFPAPRTDLSVMRLRHYTGTSAAHFQNYVIFTNYQFYVDEFVRICHDLMNGTTEGSLAHAQDEYTAFVEPGDIVTLNRRIANNPDAHWPQGAPPPRLPQMPGYHLKRADGSGITMINIGVGPSNAKTITDHVAVLRPHAWMMLGHCAGLRNSQSLGDYALAHAYLRLDHILDHDLPPQIPLPALSEIQLALEQAVGEVTGLKGYDLKKIMRTGTVATVDDRNWELQPTAQQNLPLSRSRAIALDMESGTIAANGFRFRVPYGTLLCISDMKAVTGQPVPRRGLRLDGYQSRSESRR